MRLFKNLNSPNLELATFRRQNTTFVSLNLLLLAILLSLHSLFSSFWGTPSRPLVCALGCGFLLKTGELIWVRSLSKPLRPGLVACLTWASIILTLALVSLLSALTDHEDSPYYVLMVIPILEAAFRFRIASLLGVIALADFVNFFWLRRYFEIHPPVEVSEYYEAAITSLMFAAVGLLVWWLVNDLRRKEARLALHLLELQRAREMLLQEERLAAVGRVSSAIAHEIRNPVSMIASSIATARQLQGTEKEEMFQIASDEASRLVSLTTDFLAFARPRQPRLEMSSVEDNVTYVAEACRAHAGCKHVEIVVDAPEEIDAELDSGLLQQAFMNMLINAIEASPPHGTVRLRTRQAEDVIRIEVENSGAPIPAQQLDRIFEPFFTTRSTGTGLGLPIARNIARSHHGDLSLAVNGPDTVCFVLTLPQPRAAEAAAR